MSAFLWKKNNVGHVIQAWWRMKSTSVHVGCPGWKEARGSLVKLIEQAQPGIGLLLQHKEKFIRIMLHANADSGVEIFYMIIMFLDRTA